MSGCPFDVGDVVVCIDDRPSQHPYFAKYGIDPTPPCRMGRAYRVRAVALSEAEEPGVLLHGICAGHYVKTGREIVLDPSRFRKIDADVSEEFRHAMRSIKQRKTVSA